MRYKSNMLIPIVFSGVLGASVIPLVADVLQAVNDHQGSEGSCNHDKMVALPDGVKTPEMSLQLFKDSVTGFNLHIEIQDFELESPEFSAVSHNEVAQGHAHLFINGEKIKRLYGCYEHLPGIYFKAGANEILVTLNHHDHSTWAVNGIPISATLIIDAERNEKLPMAQ